MTYFFFANFLYSKYAPSAGKAIGVAIAIPVVMAEVLPMPTAPAATATKAFFLFKPHFFIHESAPTKLESIESDDKDSSFICQAMLQDSEAEGYAETEAAIVFALIVETTGR